MKSLKKILSLSVCVLLVLTLVNLIVGVTTGLVLLVYWLHGLRERGEAE